MQKQIDEVMDLVEKYGHHVVKLNEAKSNADIANALAVTDENMNLIESKLRELLPVWQPIDTAPVQRDVLAVNGLGYIGRAHQDSSGRWNHIGKPIGWMPLPKAPE